MAAATRSFKRAMVSVGAVMISVVSPESVVTNARVLPVTAWTDSVRWSRRLRSAIRTSSSKGVPEDAHEVFPILMLPEL